MHNLLLHNIVNRVLRHCFNQIYSARFISTKIDIAQRKRPALVLALLVGVRQVCELSEGGWIGHHHGWRLAGRPFEAGTSQQVEAIRRYERTEKLLGMMLVQVWNYRSLKLSGGEYLLSDWY